MVFRFLKLPGEIRNRVYSILMGDVDKSWHYTITAATAITNQAIRSKPSPAYSDFLLLMLSCRRRYFKGINLRAALTSL